MEGAMRSPGSRPFWSTWSKNPWWAMFLACIRAARLSAVATRSRFSPCLWRRTFTHRRSSRSTRCARARLPAIPAECPEDPGARSTNPPRTIQAAIRTSARPPIAVRARE
jgi:hypothetical protein